MVASNSGIDENDVAKAYMHLFINKYELDGGLTRFDADYDISQSWQRLREGKNVQQHDLILLHHESMEYDLMAKGMSYTEAHAITERSFNYTAAVEAFKKGG